MTVSLPYRNKRVAKKHALWLPTRSEPPFSDPHKKLDIRDEMARWRSILIETRLQIQHTPTLSENQQNQTQEQESWSKNGLKHDGIKKQYWNVHKSSKIQKRNPLLKMFATHTQSHTLWTHLLSISGTQSRVSLGGNLHWSLVFIPCKKNIQTVKLRRAICLCCS